MSWCVWWSEVSPNCQALPSIVFEKRFNFSPEWLPWSFQEICWISFVSPCKSARITEASSQGCLPRNLILILHVYTTSMFPVKTSPYSLSYVSLFLSTFCLQNVRPKSHLWYHFVLLLQRQHLPLRRMSTSTGGTQECRTH